MARILIGWELGANRGHIVRILRYRDALVAAGHDVSLALQRVDAAAGEGRRDVGAAWQAPLWPGLTGSVGTALPLPVTLGDILARVGLVRIGTLAAMIAAWDRIVAAERPDVVIADFAPALLCAARGRVASIAVGTGFMQPPPAMARFPALTEGKAAFDEAELLRLANAELAQAGRPLVAALPGLFAADREIVAVLDALEPYREWREGPLAAPDIPTPLPPIADGSGDELFVYWPEQRMMSAALWEGLRDADVPVRFCAPGIGDAEAAALEAIGFAVERRAMGWDRIRMRARMILSHGGAGTVTMAMLVGLPQLVLHYDLEKGGNGRAVERLGLGAQAPANGAAAERIAALVRAVWDDGSIGQRCRTAAAPLRAGMGRDSTEATLEAVASLCRKYKTEI